jgi:hypothetical protein
MTALAKKQGELAALTEQHELPEPGAKQGAARG